MKRLIKKSNNEIDLMCSQLCKWLEGENTNLDYELLKKYNPDAIYNGTAYRCLTLNANLLKQKFNKLDSIIDSSDLERIIKECISVDDKPASFTKDINVAEEWAITYYPNEIFVVISANLEGIYARDAVAKWENETAERLVINYSEEEVIAYMPNSFTIESFCGEILDDIDYDMMDALLEMF